MRLPALTLPVLVASPRAPLSSVRPSSWYVRLSSGLSLRRVRVTGTDGPLCPWRFACNVQSLPQPRLNTGLLHGSAYTRAVANVNERQRIGCLRTNGDAAPRVNDFVESIFHEMGRSSWAVGNISSDLCTFVIPSIHFDGNFFSSGLVGQPARTVAASSINRISPRRLKGNYVNGRRLNSGWED